MVTPADELTVRRLTSNEVQLYREIRLESLRLNPDAYGSAFEIECGRSLDWFTDRLTGCEVFGAFRSGRLMGIAGFVIDDGPKRRHLGHVWGVYVREGERGRGIARRLCEAVIQTARGQVEVVQLTVTSSNIPARRLYLHLGFQEFGLEPKARKVNGEYYDDVHMSKELS